MHEVSLMYSICGALAESAKAHGLRQIHKVRLVVGTDCLVLPDALLFAFEMLKREPLTPDAVLEIEARPGRDLLIESFEGEP